MKFPNYSTIQTVLWIALLLSISACATSPKRIPHDKSWGYNISTDHLWSAVISYFGENNIPFSLLEKDSGIIVSDWMKMTKDQFSQVNCGIPALFTTVHGRRMKFNILVRSAGKESNLTVNCQYQEHRRIRGVDIYATCLSNGVIEKSIKNEILGHLNNL